MFKFALKIEAMWRNATEPLLDIFFKIFFCKKSKNRGNRVLDVFRHHLHYFEQDFNKMDLLTSGIMEL